VQASAIFAAADPLRSESFPNSDPHEVVELTEHVAVGLFRSGNRGRAVAMVKLIAGATSAFGRPLLRSETPSEFAAFYAAMGAADSVNDLVQLIREREARCSSALHSAKNLRARGMSTAAANVVQNCRPRSDDDRIYLGDDSRSAFISALLQVGAVAVDAPVLDSIATSPTSEPFPASVDEVFESAVADLTQAGRLYDARGLLRRISDAQYQSRARAHVVIALARADSIVGAMAMYRQIDPEFATAERSLACGELAALHARFDRIRRARQRAHDCTEEADVLRGYGAILRHHALSRTANHVTDSALVLTRLRLRPTRHVIFGPT
jgi:hypothetical protein